MIFEPVRPDTRASLPELMVAVESVTPPRQEQLASAVACRSVPWYSESNDAVVLATMLLPLSRRTWLTPPTLMVPEAVDPAPTASACVRVFRLAWSWVISALRSTTFAVTEPLPWRSTRFVPLFWPMLSVASVVPSTPRPPTSAVTMRLDPVMAVWAKTVATPPATIVPFMFVCVM